MEAIQTCKNTPASSYNIFSGSLSVITNLDRSYWPGKNLVFTLRIKEKIRSLENRNKTVKLIWTLAHEEIEGNEEADFLAKEATRFGVDSQICVPLRDLKSF